MSFRWSIFSFLFLFRFVLFFLFRWNSFSFYFFGIPIIFFVVSFSVFVSFFFLFWMRVEISTIFQCGLAVDRFSFELIDLFFVENLEVK